jgi:transcriptional regulator with XRE-family HTH domain
MRFRVLREIFGYSQGRMARKVGISQQAWAELEKQRKEIRKGLILEVLKEKFGVNPEFVLGRSSYLFVDYEKGLEFYRSKLERGEDFLTRFELLSLLDICRWVWANSFGVEETRQEFKKALVEVVRYLLSLNYPRDKELSMELLFFGKDFKEALENVERLPSTVQLVKILADVSCKLLEVCELTREDEEVLSSLVWPWGVYVGFSLRTIKQGLVPVSIVHFSLEALSELNGEQERERLVLKEQGVSLELDSEGFVVYLKDRVKLVFDRSEVYAFFLLLRKVKKGGRFSVLDFSVQDNEFTVGRASFKLDKNELEDLKELVQKIQRNAGLWLKLQKSCIERFGFV